MLKSSPILFALARTPGNKFPRNVGAVVVHLLLIAIYGGVVRLRCCAGLCTVYGSPDVIS